MEDKNIGDIVREGWDKVKQNGPKIGWGVTGVLFALSVGMAGYGLYEVTAPIRAGATALANPAIYEAARQQMLLGDMYVLLSLFPMAATGVMGTIAAKYQSHHPEPNLQAQ
jgi:hypothetical protein